MGEEVVHFLSVTDDLYRLREEVSSLLNTGKPQELLTQNNSDYLFVRPDLIVTSEGLKICEIETSPFGLGLSHLLNTGYTQAGFETLSSELELSNYVQSKISRSGQIVFSDKTKSYKGQLEYTAQKIFSNEKQNWSATHIHDFDISSTQPMYRAFYLSESLMDDSVNQLVNLRLQSGDITPSITPHLEEKAILALIWDRRFENFYKKQLGETSFNQLREHIPKTWIIGQEEHFSPGMPKGISTTIDLAGQTRKNRQFVVKPSGFSANSSWAEGVSLMHEKSSEKATQILTDVCQTTSHLYVVQEFHQGQKRTMNYHDNEGETQQIAAKIRVTPYYSTVDGRLLTVKATGCENTDFIHASSASINTAVSSQTQN
jgi:hypothetical protein